MDTRSTTRLHGNCSICLEDKPQKKLVRGQSCGQGHGFCELCLQRWRYRSDDCPVCRKVIEHTIGYDDATEPIAQREPTPSENPTESLDFQHMLFQDINVANSRIAALALATVSDRLRRESSRGAHTTAQISRARASATRRRSHELHGRNQSRFVVLFSAQSQSSSPTLAVLENGAAVESFFEVHFGR
jgi:hypothetical protein